MESVKIELNHRTPCWCLRVAWWCWKKHTHIGIGVRFGDLEITEVQAAIPRNGELGVGAGSFNR